MLLHYLNIQLSAQRFLQNRREVDFFALCHCIQPRRNRQRFLYSLLIIEFSIIHRVAVDQAAELVFTALHCRDIRSCRSLFFSLFHIIEHQAQRILRRFNSLCQCRSGCNAPFHVWEIHTVSAIFFFKDCRINILSSHSLSFFIYALTLCILVVVQGLYSSPALFKIDFNVPVGTSSVLWRPTVNRFPVAGLHHTVCPRPSLATTRPDFCKSFMSSLYFMRPSNRLGWLYYSTCKHVCQQYFARICTYSKNSRKAEALRESLYPNYLSSSALSFSFARQSVRNFGIGAPSLAAFSTMLPSSVTMYQIATKGKKAVLYVNGKSKPRSP
nr:MAG TPA: hypothetical protein [Caudoviricetes sp.]